MRYSYLAALLLLPASKTVYGSWAAWRQAWRMGARAFFAQIVKKGPRTVHRSGSILRDICVYYPMQMGLELLHGLSLRQTLHKSWQILRMRIHGDAAGHNGTKTDHSGWTDSRVPFVPVEHIRALLADPGIMVVSFDIFDTLLLRPVLEPADLFLLVARKVDPLYGVDFASMRGSAEAELGMPDARLDDIYTHMARRYGLADATRDALKAEEVACERTVLTPRPDVKALYEEARRLGKRVIAVSDMYLPSQLLDDILREKGMPVDAVYVSCEQQARKSDGALYECVLAQEGVPAAAVLHTGDNFQSDYVQAIRKNICAVWLPSIRERALGCEEVRQAFDAAVRQEPMLSFYLGHALNRLYGMQVQAPEQLAHIRDLRHLTELCIAPIVTAFAVFLHSDRTIQSRYRQIYFASRDGWLPYVTYEALRTRLGGIPGRYFYAGRRAYYPLLHDDFFSFARSLQRAADVQNYTLRHFITAWFGGSPLEMQLTQACTEEELDLPFFPHKEECLSILRRCAESIEAFFQGKRQRAQNYYRSVFADIEDRHLVFDLGYSGSVGIALSNALGRPVDKIYFWQSEANAAADKEYSSTTYLFMDDMSYVPYHLLFEELFSPYAGGVSDFDEYGRPILNSIDMPEMKKNNFSVIEEVCLNFLSSFTFCMGNYTYLSFLHTPSSIRNFIYDLLWKSPYRNLSVLKNIKFSDPVYHSNNNSLEYKIEKFFPAKNIFSGTGFDDPVYMMTPVPPKLHMGMRIGIHVHLFHIWMAEEIIRYLQDFPVKFDLYCTITDESFAATAEKLFSTALLPQRGRLQIVTVPNRGRDVAPWVLSLRPWQKEYDVFCHIHTKASDMGRKDEWRRYLYDNCIRAAAAAHILGVFQQYPEIGCIFPAIYPRLRQVMIRVGLPLYGSEHEYQLITDLLRRMDLPSEYCRSDQFFSGGTMLWYRPHALRQLFSVDLRLEEFSPEPIGVGGTLAHAIERLPAVIAIRNGYDVKTLTIRPAP